MIVRHALADGVQNAQVVLRRGIALLGGLVQPGCRLRVILWSVLARQVHPAQHALRGHMTLLRRTLHAPGRLAGIRGLLRLAQQRQTTPELRLGVAVTTDRGVGACLGRSRRLALARAQNQDHQHRRGKGPGDGPGRDHDCPLPRARQRNQPSKPAPSARIAQVAGSGISRSATS